MVSNFKTWTHHDRSYRNKGVVHPSCFRDAACLESNLQTAATHAEAHRIHIDVIRKCCTVASICKITSDRKVSSELYPGRPPSCSLESSGHLLRSKGIVGSMNGRGVFESWYIGMFIATLAPLLLRMLAVRVLERVDIVRQRPVRLRNVSSTHGKRT